MPKRISLDGRIFGKLTVIKYNGNDNYNNALWLCQCECGKTKTINSASLRKGKTKSCGCFHKQLLAKNSTIHGMSNSKEFASWWNMRERCFNPKDKRYHRYGERGITICQRWLDGFQNFYDDMGKCPKNYTIERINNDGNYEPSNCIWASRKIQARNRNITRWFTYNGKKLCYAEVSRKLKIPHHKLRYLIEDKGLSLDDAISYMKENKYKKLTWSVDKAICLRKEGYSYKDIGTEFGVTGGAIFTGLKLRNLT